MRVVLVAARGVAKVVRVSSVAAGETKFGYRGPEYQEFIISEGAGDQLRITARGGGGGAGWRQVGREVVAEGTVGAETSGVLDVEPGDVIRFGIGCGGQEWRDDDRQSKGGWGGQDASGADGVLMDRISGAAGGGATTVELVRDGQSTTVMVAGGGGGDGAPYLGLLDWHIKVGGVGGNGGDGAAGRSAKGSDGGDGEDNPLSGGRAGCGHGRTEEEDYAHERGTPGGGGGGGLSGGATGLAGAHTGGGGGGAGSSMVHESVHTPKIQAADKTFRAQNGEFKYAWV